MEEKMREIAILLATYNGEKYIGEQLKSLVNQTEQNFICYIHDDGSNDKTLKIIDEFKKDYPEKFVIWNYDSCKSAKNNFLSMLSKIKEKYVMFCDQDDIWLPNKIQKTFNKMREEEKKFKDFPICVFTDMKVVDEKLNVISNSFFKKMKKNPENILLQQLLADNVVAGCTSMINKSCIELCNKYVDAKNIKMHDWWCALVAESCGKLVFLNETTSLYRQHSDNVVGIHKSKLNWFFKIIKNVCNHNQIESSRQGIKSIIRICKELSNLDRTHEKYKTFLNQISSIDELPKFKRMEIFARNKLIKRDLKNFWKIILV